MPGLTKDPYELLEKGYAAIKKEDFKAARTIGARLEKMRFTGGFEILGLALAGMNKKAQAIRVLEKGVKEAPSVYLLWNLLGNYLSDMGKFQKAEKAFAKGLECKNADRVLLNFNYALVLKRRGDVPGAFKRLQGAFKDRTFAEDRTFSGAPIGLVLGCHSLLIELLNKRGEFKKAKTVFKRFFRKHSSDDLPSAPLSSLYSEHAFSLWKMKRVEAARRMLLKAVELDKFNGEAQYLLREMNASSDFSRAKYFRVLIEGEWKGSRSSDGRDSGFLTTYDVVANDEKEALGFILPFEPRHVRESLRIEEAKVLRSKKQPKGVYQAIGGYVFYPLKRGKKVE